MVFRGDGITVAPKTALLFRWHIIHLSAFLNAVTVAILVVRAYFKDQGIFNASKAMLGFW